MTDLWAFVGSSCRSLRGCCLCWMRRARACGQQSRRCTRGCQHSWTPVPRKASLSPPRMEMETPHPKTRAQLSLSATMLDRSACVTLIFKHIILSNYLYVLPSRRPVINQIKNVFTTQLQWNNSGRCEYSHIYTFIYCLISSVELLK